MSRSVRAVGLIGSCLFVLGCSAGVAPTGRPQNQPPQIPAPAATSAPAQPPQHGWPPPPINYPFPPPATFAPPPIYPPRPTPYQGNSFQDAGVNGFVDPVRDPFSTFAMDVDTASYSVGRRFLQDGNLPNRDSVRLEEYVNSFDYGYQPPTGSAFAIYVDGAPTPFNYSGSFLVRVGIQAKAIPDESRTPVSLTFVIDTSGSMSIDGRLDLVKAALGLLVSRLHPEDSIAIVQFGTTASVVLNPTSVAEPDSILRAIDSLAPNGSTNAEAGLELGYQLASLGHRDGATDRVILASDGVANTGLTDASSILAQIADAVNSGIDLVTIGVGMGNFNDVLLEQLADHGNGFYAYINDRFEADSLFGTRLTGTLETVAKDAKVQVEFRPEAVSAYRLIGYEDRGLPDQQFRNPTVDAGEVGAGHSVTALYEIDPLPTADGFLGTVRLRWTDPTTGAEQQAARDIETTDFVSDYRFASPSFRLAATVAGFAEILRQSPYVQGYTLAQVEREAQSVAASLPDRADVSEFVQLTAIAARLSGGD